MADRRLRERIHSGRILVAPGVFDMLSARIAQDMGFDAVYMTGNGQCASALGLPDAGFMTLTEMAERVRRTAACVSVPIIADADTGFGGILNVRRTVQEYERAGASALHIEDQVLPKKCGHTLGREVVAAEEMALKVRAAVDARRSDDFLIIARCDARTAHGLEEAIRRGEIYAQAGADMIFIEAPESEAEFAEIARRIRKPVMANMVEFSRSPLLPIPRLQELGYALVIFPASAVLAASHAIREAYRALQEEGTTSRLHDRMLSLEEYHRLLGFPEVWALEERYGLKDYAALEARFGRRS